MSNILTTQLRICLSSCIKEALSKPTNKSKKLPNVGDEGLGSGIFEGTLFGKI